MKRFLSGIVMTTMLSTSVVPYAFAADSAVSERNLIDNIHVYYNASLVDTVQPALMENGRVSLALRDFFEGINVPVAWDSDTRSATVTTESKKIMIFPDNGRIIINDQEMTVDAKPQMVGYHIYVPLRFLSEQLGYQVDYTAESGTHVIRITGGAPEMTKLHDGHVTRITNRTIAVEEPEQAQENSNYTQWKANNIRHFIDSDGELYQVVSTGSAIELRYINATKAKVETTSYSTPTPFAAFGKITSAGRSAYDLQINPSTDMRYIGVGTPTESYPIATFHTDIGNLLLYPSKAVDTVLNINNTTGVLNGVYDDPSYGFVLDTIELSTTVNDGGYAIADNGNYGFLIDGFFLIIDPLKYEVVYSEMISADLEDSQIFAKGNNFIITGVENSRFTSRMGYYTAVYDAFEGQTLQFYSSMLSRIQSNMNLSDLGYIEPLDSYMAGDTIYTLFKTQWDHYLGVYDYSDGSFSLTELPYNYTTFIPTPTGHALFARDSAYFYIQTVQ